MLAALYTQVILQVVAANHTTDGDTPTDVGAMHRGLEVHPTNIFKVHVNAVGCDLDGIAHNATATT